MSIFFCALSVFSVFFSGTTLIGPGVLSSTEQCHAQVHEDNHNNKNDLKTEDDLKNKTTSKMKRTSNEDDLRNKDDPKKERTKI